jgi:hypothetical protein
MSARAIVKLTVEVTLSECWGDDWKLQDVYRSASESARNLLDARMKACDFRVVGTPEVVSVITENKK